MTTGQDVKFKSRGTKLSEKVVRTKSDCPCAGFRQASIHSPGPFSFVDLLSTAANLSINCHLVKNILLHNGMFHSAIISFSLFVCHSSDNMSNGKFFFYHRAKSDSRFLVTSPSWNASGRLRSKTPRRAPCHPSSSPLRVPGSECLFYFLSLGTFFPQNNELLKLMAVNWNKGERRRSLFPSPALTRPLATATMPPVS